MKDFWKEVLQLPYETNTQTDSRHEQQVMKLLDKWKFNYLYQPNGTQNSPDFRVFLPSGKTVDIECKSSKQAHPTYNGGLPKEGVVYVFSSKKYNQTTVFFAEDVVSERKRELYCKLAEDLNSVLKQYQMEEDWKEDDRGFDFYIRHMYTQAGGKAKTDYFTHEQRNYCEERVLNFDW